MKSISIEDQISKFQQSQSEQLKIHSNSKQQPITSENTPTNLKSNQQILFQKQSDSSTSSPIQKIHNNQNNQNIPVLQKQSICSKNNEISSQGGDQQKYSRANSFKRSQSGVRIKRGGTLSQLSPSSTILERKDTLKIGLARQQSISQTLGNTYDENENEYQKYLLKFEEQKTKRMLQIEKFLEKATPKEKFDKALRHLKDALYFRPPLNEEKNYSKQLIFLHDFQNHPYWKSFLNLITLIFTFQVFFEPSNDYDINSIYEKPSIYLWLTVQESIFIAIYLFDTLIALIIESEDKNSSEPNRIIRMAKNLYQNKIFMLKGIYWILIFSDFVAFQFLHLQLFNLRFARVIRPFYVFFYSREFKSTFLGICLCFRRVLDIFLLFILMAIFWGYIALNLFNEPSTDEYLERNYEFQQFGYASVSMYTLVSMDNYPSLFIDSLEGSGYYYLIFFLPYVMINLFLFLPLPSAVIFQNYISQKRKMMMEDRLIDKSSLLCCYLCLKSYDPDKRISYKSFKQLFYEFYNHKLIEQEAHNLYQILNIVNADDVQWDHFLDLQDLILNDQSMYDSSNIYWDNIREFCNKYLKFETIGHSTIWNTFIIVVVVINTSCVISYGFITDDKTLEVIDSFDTFFNSCYIIDVVIKLIGFGIQNYFDDFWNQFDFWMVIVTIATMIGVEYIYFIKKAKSGKLLKLAKVQRALRIFRSFRSIKLLKIIQFGEQTIVRVKILIQKVSLCIPIVQKLVSFIFFVIYIYAIIGIEAFNQDHGGVQEGSPWSSENSYADFNSFGSAILCLFQVCTESGWVSMMNDYAYKFGFAKSAVYFCSFHMIIILFLMSLLKGLIWEVFNAVDIGYKEEDKQQNEDQANEEEGEGEEEKEYMKDLNSIKENSQEDNNSSIQLSAQGEKVEDNINNYRKSSQSQSPTRSRHVSKINSFKPTLNRINEEDIVLKENQQDDGDIDNGNEEFGQLQTDEVFDNKNGNQQSLQEKIHFYHKVNKYFNQNNIDQPQTNKLLKIFRQTHIQQMKKKTLDNIQTSLTSRPKNENNEEQTYLKRQRILFYSKIIFPLRNKESLLNIQFYTKNEDKIKLVINEEIIMKNQQDVIDLQLQQVKFFKKNNMEEIKQIDEQEKKIKDKNRRMTRIYSVNNQHALQIKTFMKQINSEDLNNQEKKNLQKHFGVKFGVKSEIGLVLQDQNNLLMSIKRLIRYDNFQTNEFSQCIANIEKTIQKRILREGTIFKVLVQIEGQWYYIKSNNNEFQSTKFIKAGEGPWEVVNTDVISQECQIYQGIDVFKKLKDNNPFSTDQVFYNSSDSLQFRESELLKDESNPQQEDFTQKLIDNFEQISRGTVDFKDFFKKVQQWNLYTFFIQNNSPQLINERVKKGKIEFKIPTNIMICSLAIQKYTRQSQALLALRKSSIAGLEDPNNRQQESSHSSSSVRFGSSSSSRSSESSQQQKDSHINKLNQKLNSDRQKLNSERQMNQDLNEQSIDSSDQSKINQKNKINSNENSQRKKHNQTVKKLNIIEQIELLKDLRDIFYLYKENFFFKLGKAFYEYEQKIEQKQELKKNNKNRRFSENSESNLGLGSLILNNKNQSNVSSLIFNNKNQSMTSSLIINNKNQSVISSQISNNKNQFSSNDISQNKDSISQQQSSENQYNLDNIYQEPIKQESQYLNYVNSPIAIDPFAIDEKKMEEKKKKKLNRVIKFKRQSSSAQQDDD